MYRNRFFLSEVKTYLIAIFIALLLFGSVYYMNFDLINSDKYDDGVTEDVYPEGINTNMTFGYNLIMSDVYWIKTVQYIGQHVYDQKMPQLTSLLDNVTKLDPNFIYPYKVDILINGEIDAKGSLDVANRGVINNQDSWEIPYLLGYLYSFVLNDSKLGAGYFDLSASVANAPNVAKQMAQAVRRQSGNLEAALIFWQNEAETSKDQGEINKAILEINRLDNMIFLREAVMIYKQKFNKDPDFFMHDLVDTKIINRIPNDPSDSVGYGWYADEQIVKITVNENEIKK